MSAGLAALLDDVATLARAAAASVDDVAAGASRAGVKAAGVIVDDAAVTPRYVTGFSPDRELPIIWKITLGSLRNKLFILLPAALALSYFAPAVIVPLLMLGGLYLSYEGVEKLYELVFPHAAHAHEAEVQSIAPDAQALEDQKVAGAIRRTRSARPVLLTTRSDRRSSHRSAASSIHGIGGRRKGTCCSSCSGRLDCMS